MRNDGSPSRVLAIGTQPTVRTDGRALAYRGGPGPGSMMVRDLATGTERPLPLPGAAGETTGSYGWQRDTGVLVALTSRPDPSLGMSLPYGVTAPPTLPPAPWHAWTLDTSDPHEAWTALGAKGSWDNAAIIGPGPQTGSVVVAWSDPHFPGQTSRVAVVRRDGSIAKTVNLAPHVQVLDVDASGTNLLVIGPDHSISRVTFTDPTLHPLPANLDGTVDEATL